MTASILDDIQVIDTDTHVIEPADLWTSRVSVKKWGDRVPHVRFDAELGEEYWYFGDTRVTGTANPAMAFWKEYPPGHPKTLEEAHPTTTSVAERVKLMDEFGIHAHVLYPNVAGFGTGRFLTVKDPELMLACVQAYNDFLVEDYANAAPGRFVPIAALPFWDVEESVREIKRCADLGHKGIMMGSQPEDWGEPHLPDRHWDPIWATAQDLELSVNFHIASGDFSKMFGGSMEDYGPSARYASMGVQLFVGNAGALAKIIYGGICHRFPRLNFVSVESGIGWLPFALESMDWQWKNCGVPQEHPEYGLLPSEYFQRQIYGCFWFEQASAHLALDVLGADNILYETDFPHPTCMVPGPATTAVTPQEYIKGTLGDLPDDVLKKILHDNAARIYHLD
jgi:predicted TIM-barrel fold metal-dependent hydrolase